MTINIEYCQDCGYLKRNDYEQKYYCEKELYLDEHHTEVKCPTLPYHLWIQRIEKLQAERKVTNDNSN